MDGQAKFKRWKKASGLTFSAIGEKLGVGKTAAHNWASGTTKPSRDNAIALERLSEGEVTVSDWSDQVAA